MDLLAAARDEDVSWREEVVRVLLEEEFGETSHPEERAAKSEAAWTPEKIALALRVQRLWPEREHEWRWLWAPTFKHGNIYHQTNLVTLARILKVSEPVLLIVSMAQYVNNRTGIRVRK